MFPKFVFNDGSGNKRWIIKDKSVFVSYFAKKEIFFKYLNDKLIKNERMKIGMKVYMIKEWKEERKEGGKKGSRKGRKDARRKERKRIIKGTWF